jgi:hypothetical protein
MASENKKYPDLSGGKLKVAQVGALLLAFRRMRRVFDCKLGSLLHGIGVELSTGEDGTRARVEIFNGSEMEPLCQLFCPGLKEGCTLRLQVVAQCMAHLCSSVGPVKQAWNSKDANGVIVRIRKRNNNLLDQELLDYAVLRYDVVYGETGCICQKKGGKICPCWPILLVD